MRAALSTLPTLAVLGFVVLSWTVGQLDSRMIQLGEQIWPGYAVHVRNAAEPEAPPTADAPASDDDLIADLLGDDVPVDNTSADDDLIADLLAGEAVVKPTASPTPAMPRAPATEETLLLKVYRAVDRNLAAFAALGAAWMKHLLVLLVILCGATATATRHHISLRPPTRRHDVQVSETLQLLVNLGMAASCVVLTILEARSGAEILHPELPMMWAAGLGGMALLNARNLLRLPTDVALGGSFPGGLLATPLYVWMAALAGIYFLQVEAYPAGPAVYLQKLTEHANVYMFIGLYVWVGMLLKRTQVTQRGFDVLRPWRLPPELLVAFVVIAAAIPTAYSGASGIFVIAVGAVIYQELRNAGARRQLALAATAMSGSLGVVLSPCLLVVIVAYLNPVDSQTLYQWGRWVFLLTGGLFTLAVLLTRQSALRIASVSAALPESLRRLRGLGGYALVFIGLLLGYGLVLEAKLDEHTAPMILPVVLGGFLLLERRQIPDKAPVTREVVYATEEAAGHIGALLLLMGLSIALGGVFERSEVMSLFPQDLGSPWQAMAVLVVALVVIGMTMDPYGAVILVSVTLAEIAYANGINEAHFWMVVLVAFELGYLTPPVALNHLLTRQVVGEEALIAETSGNLWRRHERLLLPLAVMSVALLLVAFVPLAFGK